MLAVVFLVDDHRWQPNFWWEQKKLQATVHTHGNVESICV